MIKRRNLFFAVAVICAVIAAAAIALVSVKSGGNADRSQETTQSQSQSESTSNSTTDNSLNETEADINSVKILVNTENPLPQGREIELAELSNGHQVDKRAYDSLVKMLDAASALGYNPVVASAYRSHETQVTLFNNKISYYENQGLSHNEAYERASGWLAVPGTSEHETGLALDIVSAENQVLDESQAETGFQQWMMENCYDYGFILRYPKDKTDITGINFEPWHYRYVGKELAQYIKEKGICLEEYYAASTDDGD